MNTLYTITLEVDPESGELIMPLPTDLLSQMGWDYGDELAWSDNNNGSFSLSKVADKSTVHVSACSTIVERDGIK